MSLTNGQTDEDSVIDSANNIQRHVRATDADPS